MLKWLRASRRIWRKRRLQAQRNIDKRSRQIEAEKKRLAERSEGPARAVKFLSDRLGWHEDPGRPNRAVWLDKWAREVGEWMVAQPWCGLTIWQAAKAAGVKLTAETMSTVAIRNHAQAGTGGFKAWHSASATPQLGWVAIYGTGGPEHTGMYAGNGMVYEGNTSSGSGGSQNNGGGLYPRKLAERRGWLLGWAEISWEKTS